MSGDTIARAHAEQQQRPTLAQIVHNMGPEIQRALPRGMDGERVARLALTVLRQTPALASCSAESFAGALLTACALGLEPGVDGEAWLVPYGTECTFIAGYKGLAKLYFQHPLAHFLDAQTVREADFFDYEKGLDPYLRHKPARGDRGEPVAFYAVASLTTGARFFEVLTPEEVATIRGASGRRRPSVPDPQLWLPRKTALRQLFKLTPRSTRLDQALTVDERAGTDLAAHKVPEQITDGNDASSQPAPDVELVEDSPAEAEGE